MNSLLTAEERPKWRAYAARFLADRTFFGPAVVLTGPAVAGPVCVAISLAGVEQPISQADALRLAADVFGD